MGMETRVNSGYGVGSKAVMRMESGMDGALRVGGKPVVGVEAGMDGGNGVRCKAIMRMESRMESCDWVGGKAVVGVQLLGGASCGGHQRDTCEQLHPGSCWLLDVTPMYSALIPFS